MAFNQIGLNDHVLSPATTVQKMAVQPERVPLQTMCHESKDLTELKIKMAINQLALHQRQRQSICRLPCVEKCQPHD